MTAKKDAPPAGRKFPCPGCGAKVEFDPRARALVCPFCGHSTALQAAGDTAEVVERDYDEYLARAEGEGGAVIPGRSSQVRCTGCGAMVLLEDHVVTENCPFCSTHLEHHPVSAAGMIPPESLAPFALDLRAARGAFDAWLGSLWFAPSALRKVAALGRLAGVYLPYWTYDSQTRTRYRGQRGDNYTVTETYTDRDAEGKSVTRTRTVTHVRWSPASGTVDHFFDDVLVCGSRGVPAHLVPRLAPWDLDRLEGFRAEFLSGFKTERYAVGLAEGFADAKQLMQPTIDTLVRQDIGGDHQRVESQQTRYQAVTFKHLLLPVWVASYRYKETLFQILINGRTGRLAGERPWSVWKIMRLVLAVFLLAGLVAFLVVRFQR